MDNGQPDRDSASVPKPRSRLRASQWMPMLVGLLVTVGCLAWAFHSMTKDESPQIVLLKIKGAFKRADYLTLPFLWVILAVFYWLKAYRWKLLLAPVRPFEPGRELLPPIMVGFAFNNVLPLRLGELARVVVFATKHTLAMSTVLASVALERILDALTILGLLALGIWNLEQVSPDIRGRMLSGSVAVGAAAAAIVVYLIWTRPFIFVAAWCLRRMPVIGARFEQKFIAILEAGAVGLAALKSGRLLAGIAATSVAQWVLNTLYFIVCLRAFQIDVPWPGVLVLMGVVAFGVAVPSVPGYFGVMQLLFMLVLQLFGAHKEQVFAASIYYQMSQFIPVTLTGLLCFAGMGIKMKDIRRENSPPEEPSN